MQPARRGISLAAALGAAALVGAADCVALGRAWGSAGERAGAMAAVLAALMMAAAVCWSFGVLAVRLLPKRRAWAALAAAAPVIVFLAVDLGQTHNAHALLGRAAPLAALVGLVLGYAGLLRAAEGMAFGRVAFGRVAFGRVAFGAAGVALAVANAWLPARLYPSVRGLGVAGAVWLIARSLNGSTNSDNGSTIATPGLVRAWTAAVLLGALSFGLQQGSSNGRFLARTQAPSASLLFDAIARLHPTPLALPDGAAQAAARAPEGPGPARPDLGDANLLLITVDALRADRPLPQVAARAPGAIRFQRAYAQAPQTAFSITSLLTSTHPARLAASQPTLPSAQGPGAHATLAEILLRQHWFTDAFYPAGLFFDGRSALEHYARSRFGFEWTDTRTLDAHALTDAVLARLAAPRFRSAPRTFTWVHYFDPHEPYVAHGVPDDAPARARYDSEVAYTDREIARLLDGVAAGMRDGVRPTLVVLTADHGEEFGEHGGAYHGTSLYEEQIHVPLALFTIGAAPLGPRAVEAPVELVDVMPTVLELLGVARSGELEGRSLTGLFGSAPAPVRDAHAEEHSRRLLVRGGWKLIHDQHGDVDELYDLTSDPAEARNRAGERPELVASLHASLTQWFNLSSPDALIQTLGDARRPAAERLAAARALAEAEVPAALPALRAALDDPARAVAAEAALALAELADSAALPSLRALLEVPALRRRAALGLGRLRDPGAVPALLETTFDIDVTSRRHALHYLGFLAGEEAVPAIEARALADLKARSDAYLALGRIAERTGSAQAARFLAARFADEPYDDGRQNLAWALALAGARHPGLVDALTIDRLASAAAADPPLPFASEALVRLHARGTPRVAGLDFACTHRADENRFADATTCPQLEAPVRLRVPAGTISIGGAVVLVRVRSLADGPVVETLAVDGRPFARVPLTARFAELRIALPPGAIAARGGELELRVEGAGATPLAELDHLLVVANRPSPAP